MQLDKTIRENQYGSFLVIGPTHFDEGIEYAYERKISQIHLRMSYAYESKDALLDFKKLELLQEQLRILFIQRTLENITNLDSVYSLKNLERIHVSDKQKVTKFTLDISKFENLTHFGGIYWKGLMNIDKAYSLKSIVIRKFPDVDLKILSNLRNLEVVHVYSSKIQSLDGIQNLPIKRVFFARNNLLEDIEALRELNKLEDLRTEKCKKITEHDLLRIKDLQGNTGLEINYMK